MPVSSIDKIPAVMSIFKYDRVVKSVLDVGSGFGKYGFLTREYLDIRKKRYRKRDWITRIDALESWPNYIHPAYQYVYNMIYIGNALHLSRVISRYDVILVIDMIEHLRKGDGKRLLNNLFKKCNFGIVVTFPDTFRKGIGSDWPNPREEHKCLWTFKEVSKMFDKVKLIDGSAVHIFK